MTQWLSNVLGRIRLWHYRRQLERCANELSRAVFRLRTREMQDLTRAAREAGVIG